MPESVRLIIVGALLVHGLGHGGALGAFVWIRRFPGTQTGGWRAAHTWAFPALSATAATAVASAFWIAALVGFVVAAVSFWGVLLPGTLFRPLAAVSAVVSVVGIALFLGTWPMFNTLAAMAVNAAVFAGLLWPREV